MVITDGTHTAEIIMMMDGYPDDMSYFHFGAGQLPCTELPCIDDMYHVVSVSYCICEARAWEAEKNGRYVTVRML